MLWSAPARRLVLILLLPVPRGLNALLPEVAHLPRLRAAVHLETSKTTTLTKRRRGLLDSTDPAQAVVLDNAEQTKPNHKGMRMPEKGIKGEDDDKDKFLRSLRLWVQHSLRDSGLLRLLMDIAVCLGIPALLHEYPTALPQFFRLSGVPSFLWKEQVGVPASAIHFETLRYGPHALNTVDLMVPETPSPSCQKQQTPSADDMKPLILFVHGGAWGSGNAALYRLVATPFVNANLTVAILGYRTYPDSQTVQDQVDDLDQALSCLLLQRPARRVILIGHSTGAHIISLATLQGKLQQRKDTHVSVIGLAGVYNIPSHYHFEKSRGINRLSPMAAICGGTLAAWRRASPTWLLRRGMLVGPGGSDDDWPPTLILHGQLDTVVPWTSSAEYVDTLHKTVLGSHRRCQIKLLEDVGHAEMILELMFGGATQDAVMHWIEQQIMDKRPITTPQ